MANRHSNDGQPPTLKHRTSFVQTVLQHVAHPPPDHRLAADDFDSPTNVSSCPLSSKGLPSASNAAKEKLTKKTQTTHPDQEQSQGFWQDLWTMKWMRHPGSSIRLILIFIVPWLLLELLTHAGLIHSNPLSAFVLISHPLPLEPDETYYRYGKGLKDFYFLGFYIIVFSFIRQAVIEYIIRPWAIWLGLRKIKQQRFVDQGYAVFYWGSSTIIGLIVMSKQPTWWYKTSEFWNGYPHYRLDPGVKIYYLLQFAFWLQQMLILVLKIEKPRSDFTELVLHHLVTLYLVGASYLINLTRIGTAIFVSMDISDTFLAISKCLNYTKYQTTSKVSFAFFICVWTYFRHWQNLRILYSVYYDYHTLIPDSARRISFKDEVFLPLWMKPQIFVPILMLQLLNLFWYYLIWRIVFRMLTAGEAADVREEGETDDEDEVAGKEKST